MVTRLVQREIGIERALAVVHARLAVVKITPFVEAVHAEAAAFDGFEKLLGNNRISIHIDAVKRRDDGGESVKGFHGNRALPSALSLVGILDFFPRCGIAADVRAGVGAGSQNQSGNGKNDGFFHIQFPYISKY